MYFKKTTVVRLAECTRHQQIYVKRDGPKEHKKLGSSTGDSLMYVYVKKAAALGKVTAKDILIFTCG